ncbi:MAG: hypothetical protein ACLRFE_01005 [Clostridia bacterium]
MFNWFKSKIELKKDTSIMSSTHQKKGVKLDSEIIVPNNFEALIFYHGKLFYTLTSGKHKINNQSFEKLINIQKKHKSKFKYVKFVCHYVNLSIQEFNIKYKKQKYTIKFRIDNSIKFSELILLHTYKVDNNYVIQMLNDMFIELLIYLKADLQQISENSLIEYGIKIDTFTQTSKTNSIFSSCNNINNNPVINDIKNKDLSTHTNNQKLQEDVKSPILENNSMHENETKHNSKNTCSNCGNITKFSTTYCLKCGHKLQ